MADSDKSSETWLSWDAAAMDTPGIRNAVEAFCRCSQELLAARLSGPTHEACATWVDKKSNKLIVVLTSLQHRMSRLRAALEESKIDWKPVITDFEGHKETVKNMPNRKEMKADIKSLNDCLRIYDFYIATLNTVLGSWTEWEEFANLKEPCTKARNAARLQIAVRGAVILTEKGEPDDVASFLEDCKRAHVKLPAALERMLPKAASAAAAAAAAGNEDDF